MSTTTVMVWFMVMTMDSDKGNLMAPHSDMDRFNHLKKTLQFDLNYYRDEEQQGGYHM